MIFFSLICIIFSLCAYTQTTNNELKSINVKVEKYKNDDCRNEIERSNKNMVVLTFFNFYKDTLSIYVENKLIISKEISKDTAATSTDFTGFSYIVSLPFAKSNLSIASSNEKVIIKTRIKRKFPIYMISLYNSKWYISPRKCIPLLK